MKAIFSGATCIWVIAYTLHLGASATSSFRCLYLDRGCWLGWVGVEGRQDERMGGHEARYTHPSPHRAPSVPLSGHTSGIFGTKDLTNPVFFKHVRYFRETSKLKFLFSFLELLEYNFTKMYIQIQMCLLCDVINVVMHQIPLISIFLFEKVKMWTFRPSLTTADWAR